MAQSHLTKITFTFYVDNHREYDVSFYKEALDLNRVAIFQRRYSNNPVFGLGYLMPDKLVTWDNAQNILHRFLAYKRNTG